MEKIYPSTLKGPISIEQSINHGKLLAGVFSVKEAGIDSKIFHSWKLNELLPTVPKGAWAELSFIDYLWLRTLETMRKFGCSKKLMKHVCNALFIEAYKIDLRKVTLMDNITFLSDLKKKRPLTVNEEEYLTSCNNELKDKIKMATTNFDINYFYKLVLKCFVNNNEVGLIIFEDESFTTYELSGNTDIASNPINLSIPHLLIPISSFIKIFIADEEKEQFLTTTGILNEKEYEVVKQIRNKNVKKLTISCDEKNNINKIEPEIYGTIQGDEAKKIMQQLGLKNYSSVELHTRDGGTLSFTKTSKIYMNKM